MKKTFRGRRNSGQTLVISALVISLLIISVVYSVFEAGRVSETRSATTLNSHVLATKLGLKNTVTSALVNVSVGGANEVLATNLDTYVSFLANQSYFGKCVALFSVLDSASYQSGILLSWGSDGTGVSSAYANYTLFFTDAKSELQFEHATNITTGLDVQGTYSKLEGTLKQVNVTCNVFNEQEAALASSIALYYEYNGELSTQEWVPVVSPSITDYGNGTYAISFVAETQTIDDSMLVSAQVYDMRGIFVLANVTCTET
ncbi:MAG: hypothetical protein NWF06_01360 [Candidatus Bathyarchaeota archaeon]|nr:hypothetical protein [Candidatus Bathyarchaeum sp.]